MFIIVEENKQKAFVYHLGNSRKQFQLRQLSKFP